MYPKINFSLLTLLLLIPITLSAQQIVWNQFWGGSGFDNGYAMDLLPSDGSIYITGTVRSNQQDAKNPPSNSADFAVLKLNYKGEILWNKILGGTGTDEAHGIKSTQDGGCIVIGTTASLDGLVVGNHGKMDIWVIKLSRDGEVQWMQTLGGTGNDKGFGILPLKEGGYLVLGESGSKNGSMNMSYGGLDLWVAKLSLSGEMVWQRSYGGSGSEAAYAAVQLDDYSIIVAGGTDSQNFDVNPPNYGNKDLWLLHIEDLGKLLWEKSIGGEDNEEVHSIGLAQDGGLIFSGTTFSNQGMIKDHRGMGDGWVGKIDLTGNLLWSKTYGGSEPDGLNCLFPTRDKNYILVGTTQSKDGMIRKSHGSYEGWVIKINTKGEPIWQNTFGGKTQDMLYGGVETAGGEYVCVGYSESVDGDNTPTNFKGGGDFWILNLRDPGKQSPGFRPPFVLSGTVTENNTGLPLLAEVELIDNEKNILFKKLTLNPSKGSFEVVIPKQKSLSISVAIPGYLFFGDNLDIDTTQDGKHLEVKLEKIRVGAKLTLDNIVFDIASAQIKPESNPELDRILKFMNLNPSVRVALNGHTDNTGDPNTKRKLSIMRATEIKNYLTNKGLSSDRMIPRGYGMTQPVASNSTEEGRQQNRRVEIEIIAAP
jgi:outer membrane protein OmpA-like peptidoglycan-associated protein